MLSFARANHFVGRAPRQKADQYLVRRKPNSALSTPAHWLTPSQYPPSCLLRAHTVFSFSLHLRISVGPPGSRDDTSFRTLRHGRLTTNLRWWLHLTRPDRQFLRSNEAAATGIGAANLPRFLQTLRARHPPFMVAIDITTTPRGFCATGTRLQRRI